MISLSLQDNQQKVFKAGQSAGKSGSFFFFSHDNRFLIKTLRSSEKNKMLGMLDDYVAHIKQTDNKSLLARIYGIYTVKSNYFLDLDLMIMQNTSQIQKGCKKLEFDLKGSRISRRTKFNIKQVSRTLNCKHGLKDVDFIQLNREV